MTAAERDSSPTVLGDVGFFHPERNMPNWSMQGVSRRTDPVRIVPLSLPPELTQPMSDMALAAVQAPNLTYRGGPLLTAVEVVTLFWGQAWTSKQASLVDQLNAYFDFVLA